MPKTKRWRSNAVQLPLDLGVPPRTARHRPVKPQREDEGLYRAILILRESGRRVYRSGALHHVDERLLSAGDLVQLANTVSRVAANR